MKTDRFALPLLVLLSITLTATVWTNRATADVNKPASEASEPRAANGKKLLTALDLMKVANVGAPRVLFAREAFSDYDVTADGRRFVFSMLDPEAETGTLNAVLNWTALLRK